HFMTADDLIRRAVIMAIVCQGDVSYQAFEENHLVDFRRYFRKELDDLTAFADAGLVQCDDDSFCVSPLGWYVVAAIASVFDRYCQGEAAAGVSALTYPVESERHAVKITTRSRPPENLVGRRPAGVKRPTSSGNASDFP